MTLLPILRLFRVLLRGLRPISRSLHQISLDLHLIARVQEAKARAEFGLVLTAEDARTIQDIDTEISYDVAEPKLDPQTGKAVVEDAEISDYTDWGAIFKGRK